MTLSFISSLLLLGLQAQVVEVSKQVSDKTFTKTQIVLNWVPEPEFGGFYAAQVAGLYEKEGLIVDILPGGAGAPTIQMLAAGKVDFALTSASEIAIARSKGQKVVGIYSSFETSPMGIMVHKARGLKDLEHLFKKGGTLAMDRGQAFARVLEKKFGFSQMKIVPYTGGIASFLKDPEFSQQGFIFSEPITAKLQGADPDFFLLASVGYNPYIQIIAVRDEDLLKKAAMVNSFVKASRAGWEQYLKDPTAANALISKLGKMEAKMLDEATRVQIPLIQTEFAKQHGLGVMSEERWKELIQQLVDAQILKKPIEAKDCFRNL